MIRLPAALASLSPIERFGLSVLVDTSRLVPVEDPAADVVRLEVADDSPGPAELPDEHAGRHEAADGVVTVRRSYLRVLGELAGGVKEQRSTERDRHDRVPSSENPLVPGGRFRDPVVSTEGAALQKSVVMAAKRRPVRCVAPWPDGRRWAVGLTHDLDLVSGWGWATVLRAGELASKRHFAQALEVLANGAAWIGRDPVLAGVREVLDVEREFDVRATWFVICETPTLDTMRAGDVTYDPDAPATRRILGDIGEQRHEIGLHGSFATLQDPERLRKQRARLAAITGGECAGVRQHFLRMRPGATQRHMVSAGFSYDATWGFPDRNGFRLGASDVLPGWDAEAQAESGLDEVPLVWMDRALSKYKGIEDPDQWVDDALRLAIACREANGVFVALWHPNLTSPLGYPGAPPAFRRLVDVLTAGQPWADALGEIVRWRRARRSLRITRVLPDGGAVLKAARAWSGPAVLEDPRGGAAISQPWPA